MTTTQLPTESTPALRVDKLAKSFGKGEHTKQVIADVSFTVDRGTFVCIVGPSGAGKTTILRAISGLTSPTAGTCEVAGQKVEGPPQTLAVVFQDYSRSLLPWLTVHDNLDLPVRRHLSKAERADRIGSALAEVGLSNARKMYPGQLSGGMQQRVAIARALVYNPQVLLMDEPFAAVDAQTRADLEDLMLSVQREHKMTTVLVTHDIDEAIYLGNQVIVLSGAPTTVREVLDITLPGHRDQVGTKALQEYAAKRARVIELIQEAKQCAARPASPDDDGVAR